MKSVLEQFFAYARERYLIHLRKTGVLERLSDGSLTKDQVLTTYRFCNVFREDDTTTKWIRERVTSSRYNGRLLAALLVARWFNRIETLECLYNEDPEEDLLVPGLRGTGPWAQRVKVVLQDRAPIVTGAYIIKTPNGMSKLDGVLWSLRKILPHAASLQTIIEKGDSLEVANHELSGWPYLGPFMAYEVVTDLRHTHVLSDAHDIMTWANPGPGAARGLGRVYYDNPLALGRSRQSDQAALQMGMKQLLFLSKSNSLWHSDWPAWEMREVEHTLCEFDKYMRVVNGEGRPRQRYKERTS